MRKRIFTGILLCILLVSAISALANVPDNPSQLASADTIVYITRTGAKYHRNGCGSLSRSKIPISLKEAKQLGYEPCKRCNPPQ